MRRSLRTNGACLTCGEGQAVSLDLGLPTWDCPASRGDADEDTGQEVEEDWQKLQVPKVPGLVSRFQPCLKLTRKLLWRWGIHWQS